MSDNKVYGRYLSKMTDEDCQVMQRLSEAKMARSFYEPMWREWNYAFQAVFYEYSLQLKYNQNLPPPDRINNMFREPGRTLSDYRLPVEFAIIVRQLADEMSNLPKTRWVSLTQSLGERDGKSRIFNYFYDWNYYEVDGDLETFKTLLAKAIYGTSIEYIFHEYLEYPDYEPKGVKDGEVEYDEITRIVSRCRFRNIDLRHFFNDPNSTDIRDSGFCFLAINKSDDQFKQEFQDQKKWDISHCKTPMYFQEAYLNLGETRKGTAGKGHQVLYYFDVINNKVLVYSNGYRINKKDLHIPIPSLNGKPPAPFAVFYDSPVNNEFYALGKCAVLKPFREVKNKLRNAFFDISKKMAFNTLVVDPSSDFDEETYEFGTSFVRAVPDDVKPLPVSGNLEPIVNLDRQTDQDMIWATGINFLDTAQGSASETATKTAIRKESQVKIVEMGLKYNSIDGFKRRTLLLKQLLRLHMSTAMVRKVLGKDPEQLRVKTSGVQLFRDEKKPYKLYSEKVNDFGLFTMRPQDFDDDVDLVLEIGNIAATRELMKARQMEAIGMILKLPATPPPQPGAPQPPFDQREVVKFLVEWGELPKEILPPGDKPLSEQDPKDVIAKMNLLDKPPTPDELLQQQTQGQGPGMPPMPGASGAMPPPGAGAEAAISNVRSAAQPAQGA